MKVDVVFLPSDLRPEQVVGRTVVVFDVLRATTSMIAALAHGVREIRVFADLESARHAKQGAPHALLCGERECLPPEGFDLGNSPGAFSSSHDGRTMLMTTTNGTRAILAARDASHLLIGALVNAGAAASTARDLGHDITLLCAGTRGAVSMEDVIGAGAVLSALGDCEMETDAAQMSLRLFASARHDLPGALWNTQGGQNILRAGLGEDITFACRLNVFPIVAKVRGSSPCVVEKQE